VGVSGDARKRAAGVSNPQEGLNTITKAIQAITPPLDVTVDLHKSGSANVIRIAVPRGDDPPYAIDDNKIYIRDEAETTLAVRDEIVRLARKKEAVRAAPAAEPPPPPELAPQTAALTDGAVDPPRTGVEIVASEEREGRWYHVMRDLRNSSVVKNVTQKSARRLWHYAISQREKHPIDAAKIGWAGDLALLGKSQHAGKQRFDLAQRQPDGSIRVYYGVTEDGIHGAWRRIVGLED
jgi:hypothetical protein